MCGPATLSGHDGVTARIGWFIFVRLKAPTERPIFYVMPRKVVSAYLYLSYQIWLRGTKPDGTPRVGDNQRNVEFAIAAPYLEAWDLLLQPADRVPAWLPSEISPGSSIWACLTAIQGSHSRTMVSSCTLRGCTLSWSRSSAPAHEESQEA